MRLEKPDVEKYLQSNHPKGVHADFKDSLSDNREDIDSEENTPSVRSEIAEEENHVALVRAVASGFHQDSDSRGSDSGFKFYSTDPLHESINNPSDILLARDKDFNRIQLCLVTCEVGDQSIPEWIENVNEVYRTFDDTGNQDELKQQLNASSRRIDEIQHILVLDEDDYQSVRFDELSSRCEPENFAVWTCRMNGKSDLCHEDGSLIHQDLKKVLNSCFDYDIDENPIEYTMDSNPVIPLQLTLFRLIRGKQKFEDDPEPLEFNRDEFVEEYRKKLELGCSRKRATPLVTDATSEMLNLAEKIGICSKTKTNRDDRDYRVMFQGEDPTSAEEVTEQKFVTHVSEVTADWQAFEETKEEFDDDDQSSVQDWS